MERAGFVYILTNPTHRVLYTGVTNDLGRRLCEHRSKVDPDSFTARYNVSKLVLVETHSSLFEAIRREKQIKGWVRRRKIELIEVGNPHWNDLSDLLA